jgi:hypothetical protein
MMQQPKPRPFANRTLLSVFGSVPQIGPESFRRRSRRGGVGSSDASSANSQADAYPGDVSGHSRLRRAWLGTDWAFD